MTSMTTDVNSTQTPRMLTGIVTSDVRDKTITVKLERLVKYPKYEKYVRRSTKLSVHDENNSAKKGDIVIIKECRPISKTKSWILQSIKERAESYSTGE